MKIIIINTILLFIISCSDETLLSDAEVAEADRAKLYLEMNQDFDLEVKIKNFDKASFLQFSISSNDSNKFDINSYEIGDYPIIWTNLDTPELSSNSVEFIIGTIQSESGTLCTININEPNSYENMSFHIGDILILDNSVPIYYSCSLSEYSSKVPCISGGGSWIRNQDEFGYADLCYIKYYPSSTDPWELFGGEFGWSDNYCWPWQDPY